MKIPIALALVSAASVAATLDAFVQTQSDYSKSQIHKNTLPNGAVFAAPSIPGFPFYYFEFIRDSVLGMGSRLDLYLDQLKVDGFQSQSLQDELFNYAAHQLTIQANSLAAMPQTPSQGLALVKFDLATAQPFTRYFTSETDISAQRALLFIRFSNAYLDYQKGSIDNIKSANIYTSAYPATSLIKRDLEFAAASFLAESYTAPNRDLWDENFAQAHFYTRVVQRQALLEGQKFAIRMGDSGAGSYYYKIAQQIHTAILRDHWNAGVGYLMEEFNPINNLKPSNLDVAVVLGPLRVSGGLDTTDLDGVDTARFDSGEVLATAVKLAQTFATEFPINANTTTTNTAPAIGRYPEDRFNGFTTGSQGNPWFLATEAFAEISYKTAEAWCTAGEVRETIATRSALGEILAGGLFGKVGGTAVNDEQSLKCSEDKVFFESVITALVEAGDGYLRRVQRHSDNGPLSEELSRVTGFMTGAQELTLSHSGFLKVARSRRDVAAVLGAGCKC